MLIGLLAFQNGFIEHDTLVDAIHAWFADKEKPLGLTLVAWGMIDADQLDAIERMAEQQVRRDGGDVLRTLATACETIAMADLGPTPDPQAETVAADIGLGLGPAARGHAQDRMGTRYRILKHHARGGLGDVYLAEDEELGRKVALKEIRLKHVEHEQSRARFLLEAEVTGNLEHPGIVPVYGQGTYPDGRPYYAMKFIKGNTLKQAVIDFRQDESLDDRPGERPLALRRLLGRFVDVCNAIDYAHNRGVLHRDLKPSNIMLGKYGETLVVDWGLAKIVGRSSVSDSGSSEFLDEEELSPSASSEVEPTRMLSIYGTPQYMSPEQAEGQIDQLTSATDVYGLGATLYYLLTGRPPFAEKMGLDEIKPLLLGGRFPRPREVDASIAPALESIALKAMAVAPADRYASAHALADDVERWLADEPVAAHRDPITARAARWVRSHRPVVAAAMATLVVAVVGLSISTVVVSHERDTSDRMRALAVNSEAEARDAVTRLEKTLGITSDTIGDIMVYLVGERLVVTPQLQELRGYVAGRSVEVGKNLLLERPRDPKIQLIAATILRYAAVMHRLDGEYRKSFEDSDLAIKLYQGLMQARSYERLELLDKQTSVLINCAQSRSMSGDDQGALRLLESARELASSMKVEGVKVAGHSGFRTLYEQPLARSLLNSAELMLEYARFEGARAGFEESERILSAKIKRPSTIPNPSNLVLLVLAQRGQAVAARELNLATVAAERFARAEETLALYEKQVGINNNTQFLHATIHAERGLLVGMEPEGRPTAERELTTAIEVVDRVMKSGFGSLPMYQSKLAWFHVKRGQIRGEMGKDWRAGAIEDAEKVLEIVDRMRIEHPEASGVESKTGLATGLLGRLEADPAKARTLLDRAIASQGRALELRPGRHEDVTALEAHRAARAGLPPPR